MTDLPPFDFDEFDEDDYPVAAMGQLVPNLWIGDGDAQPDDAFDIGFDVVVNLTGYTRKKIKAPIGRTYIAWRIDDSPTDLPDEGMLRSIVDLVEDAVRAGRMSLVTCSAGLNRSGMVTGLVLRRLGHGPQEAVDLLREVRGPWALSNELFAEQVRRGVARSPENPVGRSVDLQSEAQRVVAVVGGHVPESWPGLEGSFLLMRVRVMDVIDGRGVHLERCPILPGRVMVGVSFEITAEPLQTLETVAGIVGDVLSEDDNDPDLMATVSVTLQSATPQVIANEIQYWESIGFRPYEEEYTPDENGLVELNFALPPA